MHNMKFLILLELYKFYYLFLIIFYTIYLNYCTIKLTKEEYLEYLWY